jgi:Rrf2 family protein
MAANTNFAVALHAMSVLAHFDDVTTSSMVAKSVNTNAVVVRRVLSKLVRAGLVNSMTGKNGGFQLARAPEKIRLVDVLRAVDDGSAFRIHDNVENPQCSVSCGIKPVLGDVLGRVDRAIERELGKATLHDVVRAMQ